MVLFDEVEKAHKDIFSSLLQLLDEGYMTDSFGRKINFKNCLIIMTSNIGVRKLQDFGNGVGFKTNNNSEVVQEEYKRDVLKKELRKFFAPEFLNRIDDVVIFNSLVKEHIDKIVKLEIDKLIDRLTSMKYNVSYESSVTDLYENETSHYEIVNWLFSYGFVPWQLVVTHWDRSLRTISLDSIFVRN